MSFEDEYVRKKKKKDPITAFLPAIGLLLIVAIGAVSYILSEPAHKFLSENMSGVPADKEVGYVVGFVIFIVLMLFIAMIYAAFAPKPPKLVSEKQLQKEKDDREREMRERKKRQRAISRKMAEERKKAAK